MSPSVSLLLLAKKNLQNLPLLFTIVMAYLRGSVSIFLFSKFIEQEKGKAVNSSANELAK